MAKSNISKEDFSKLKSLFTLNKCFYPGCDKSAIKAHSIQQSGPLLYVSDIVKGQQKHVYYLDDELKYIPDIDAFGLMQEDTKQLKCRGTGEASVFRGFCDDHDKIFTAIETVPFTASDKQCFLHSYRAFAYDMHQAKAGLIGTGKIGDLLSDEINKEGQVDLSETKEKAKSIGMEDFVNSMEDSLNGLLSSVGGIFNQLSDATQERITELDVIQKKLLDSMILEESYDKMKYCVRSVDCIFPVTASAVVPYLSNILIPSEDGTAYSVSYALSVIPDSKNSKTHFILGAFGENPNLIPQMERFKTMKTSEFLSMMSNLLIFRGKNTYLSPRMINKMTPAALNFLIETRLSKEKFKDELGVPNSEINLFDKHFIE